MNSEILQHFLDVAASAPPDLSGGYFPTWQKVSVRLQKEIRTIVAEEYFADESRVAEDIEGAFIALVYCSCGICYGRRPTEFTFDVADPSTLKTALHNTGKPRGRLMEKVSQPFKEERLKRRFLAVWRQDVVNIARRRPRFLLQRLARESALIDKLIFMGTERSDFSVKRFLKTARSAARILGIADASMLEDTIVDAATETLLKDFSRTGANGKSQ